jgi:hypothetical protein
MLQNIEYICKSILFDDQGHSPNPRGEDHLRELYTCDSLQNRIQHLKPELPTNSCHQHHRKEEKENLHTKSYKAKLERLCAARLTCRDQEVRLLDTERLQAIKTL